MITVSGVPLTFSISASLGKLATGLTPANLDSWKLTLAQLDFAVTGDVTSWFSSDVQDVKVDLQGKYSIEIGPVIRKAFEKWVANKVKSQLLEKAIAGVDGAIDLGRKELAEIDTKLSDIKERRDGLKRQVDPSKVREREIKRGMKGQARRDELKRLREARRNLEKAPLKETRGKIADVFELDDELEALNKRKATVKAKINQLGKDKRVFRRQLRAAQTKLGQAAASLAKSKVGTLLVKTVGSKLVTLALRAVPVVGWALAFYDGVTVLWDIGSFFWDLLSGKDKGPPGLGPGRGGDGPPGPPGSGEDAENDDGSAEAKTEGDPSGQPGTEGETQGEKEGQKEGSPDTPSGAGEPYKELEDPKGELMFSFHGKRLAVRIADTVKGPRRQELDTWLTGGSFTKNIVRKDGKTDKFGGAAESIEMAGKTWHTFAPVSSGHDKSKTPPGTEPKPEPTTKQEPKDPANREPGEDKSEGDYQKTDDPTGRELIPKRKGKELILKLGPKVSKERAAALTSRLESGRYRTRMNRADGAQDVFGGVARTFTHNGAKHWAFPLLEEGAKAKAATKGAGGPPIETDELAEASAEEQDVSAVLRKGGKELWVSVSPAVVAAADGRAEALAAKFTGGHYTRWVVLKGGDRVLFGGKPKSTKTVKRTTYYVFGITKAPGTEGGQKAQGDEKKGTEPGATQEEFEKRLAEKRAERHAAQLKKYQDLAENAPDALKTLEEAHKAGGGVLESPSRNIRLRTPWDPDPNQKPEEKDQEDQPVMVKLGATKATAKDGLARVVAKHFKVSLAKARKAVEERKFTVAFPTDLEPDESVTIQVSAQDYQTLSDYFKGKK